MCRDEPLKIARNTYNIKLLWVVLNFQLKANLK